MSHLQAPEQRVLRNLTGALAAASLAIGCASPYPAVLSSTNEAVAIEFEINGSLQEASALAEQECAKHGRQAEFIKVDKIATPDTRVSKYRCVDANAAPMTMPADSETEAAAD